MYIYILKLDIPTIIIQIFIIVVSVQEILYITWEKVLKTIKTRKKLN